MGVKCDKCKLIKNDVSFDPSFNCNICTTCHKDATNERTNLINTTNTIDPETVKNQMWEYRKQNTGGVMMICHQCGGSTASFCACARSAFDPSIGSMRLFQNQRK